MKTNLSPELADFLDGLAVGSIGGQFYVVDLYTFTLLTGYQIRLCSWDSDITLNGHTFTAAAPYVDRSRVKQSAGLDVDELEVQLSAPPDAQLNLTTMLGAIASGQFDAATVQVDRLFMQTAGDVSMGSLIWFKGTVSDVSRADRAQAVLTVKDKKELLNQPIPRNLYGPACRHTLFDAGCTLLKSSFQTTGSVASGSTTVKIATGLSQPGPPAPPASAPTLDDIVGPSGTNIAPTEYHVVVTYVSALGESLPSPSSVRTVWYHNHVLRVYSPASISGVTGWNVYVGLYQGNQQLQNSNPIPIGTTWTEPGTGLSQGLPPPNVPSGGYFAQGVITFTSGACAGLSRFVSKHDPDGSLTILPPLPVAPSAGDAFTIVPGCDKKMATCQQKFSNLAYFAGTPYIPSPETGI